jgi:transcriptional regulator with XRE-family HTH domain
LGEEMMMAAHREDPTTMIPGNPYRPYIAQWRAARNLTQRELAARTGLSLTTINEIETGKRKPRPTTLRRLASALETEDWNLYNHPGDSSGGLPDAVRLIARVGELGRSITLGGNDGKDLANCYTAEAVELADADGWHRAEHLRSDAAEGITLLVDFWEQLSVLLRDAAPTPEARALAESARAYQLAEWRRMGIELGGARSPRRG